MARPEAGASAAAPNVLIAGCGNMGGAMLAGWLAAGADPARFTVVDPVLGEAPAGVTLLRAFPAGGRFEAVLLAVKPQLVGEVAAALEPLVGEGVLLLSVLAGTELAALARLFPRSREHVRVMPNLAAALGKSPIALVAGEGLSAAAREMAETLVAPLGQAEWLGDESLLHAVTALGGSGPAFVYRFIEALAAGATALGLPADQAARIALATVEGAAALARASGEDPAVLAGKVASPGGTTAAGLAVLDADRAVARLIAETLGAAARRSAELAEAAR